MASRKPADRNLRLAAALKQNLKRRKAGSERARAEVRGAWLARGRWSWRRHGATGRIAAAGRSENRLKA